ncbi:unnamed protein product, partial [Prunus brigantina]
SHHSLFCIAISSPSFSFATLISQSLPPSSLSSIHICHDLLFPPSLPTSPKP